MYTTVFLLLVTVGTVVVPSRSATLDETGGYSIVVGINKETSQPDNIPGYLSQLEESFDIFSTELLKATNGIFYIKSIDLLIPPQWNLTNTGVSASLPTTHSTISSDILIASDSEETQPSVDNPNRCGLPGRQIHLPNNFLNSTNGPYGLTWKALLPLWARLRWGVWDEYGFPGDAKFPYFYNGETHDIWEETSCTNEKLSGTYEYLNGSICNVNQLFIPDEDCRFIPDAVNSASTSLMSFHWVESITSFCDKTTHNRKAPTLQNFHCNYRSIWEVIEETPDYKTVTTKVEDFSFPEFNVVQSRPSTSYRPLYILLDRGQLDGYMQPIITSIIPQIAALIGNLNDDVVVSLGEYPSEKSAGIRQLVPWTTVGLSSDLLIDTIGQWTTSSVSTHFSRAVQSAVREIETQYFANGAALLVVKADTYEDIDYEYEEAVYLSLTRNRIKLYAAEITNSILTVSKILPPNLESLTTRTGGNYAELKNNRDAPGTFQILAEQIAEDVLIPADFSVPVERLAENVFLEVNEVLTVDLRERSTITIRLSVHKSSGAVLVIDGVPNTTTYHEDEWETTHLSDMRETITYIHEFDEDEDELRVGYYCLAACEYNEGSYSQLFITETRDTIEDQEAYRLEVTVSTSADNYENMDFKENPEPFLIYAKVYLEGHPVRNAIVRADVIVEIDYNDPPLVLKDDGLGRPDTFALDGIYSAEFVPRRGDGRLQQIRVTVTSDPATLDSSKLQRLLPIDQGQIPIGCDTDSCTPVDLTEDVSVVSNYRRGLEFKNIDWYPGLNQPEHIMDLTAAKTVGVPITVHFRWTVPRILQSFGGRVVKYFLYGAVSHDDLVNTPQRGAELLAIVTENLQNPGAIQQLALTVTRQEFLYFAVEAFTVDSAVPSPLSSVARLRWELTPPPPPPPPPESTTNTPRPGPGPGPGPGPAPTPEPGPGPAPTSDPGPGPGPSSTTTADPTDATSSTTTKPFFETTGGILTIVAIVLVVLILLGGIGYWMYRQRRGRARSSSA